jgi:cytosine/adenosine deaminase-related metal-dependent hydrolase
MSGRNPIFGLVVFLWLGACAHAPVPVATPTITADVVAGVKSSATTPGILLRGKVVTMNDAGDIYPGALLWVRGGEIVALIKAGEAVPADASGAMVIETGGAIYPGLIDLHNHPEYAIYPLLPISRAYKDRYEWRFYDDSYNQRITYPQVVLANADYFNLAMEIGRYGEYKALVGGTTTLQGGRANLPYSTAECLVRNIENSRVGAKLAASRVDIGRDAVEWADLLKAKNSGLLVIHLAEGPSSRMATEYESIRKSGLIGPDLIAIHGVGLTEEQFNDMAANGVKLVWSPLSNFLLYGKTANVAAAKRAGVNISLAPDWAPSGSKSLLGELKVADLVNRHQLKSLFTDRDMAFMVTRNPAQAMGWAGRAGQVAAGFVADLLVIDDRHADPYRNLIEATEENVRVVMVRGEPLYGDAAVIGNARPAAEFETVLDFAGKRLKVMAPNCPGSGLPPMSVAETRARLQRGLDMDGDFLIRQGSAAKINLELARCPGGTAETGPNAEDARRFLACRFQLPFEKTVLSPLATSEDPDFMTRLLANPNLPAYLKALPGYYRK